MINKIVFSTIAALALPAALLANTINLVGNTSGAPTFNRPTETGARSFFTVPYDAYLIDVSLDGVFTFTLDAADPAHYDTFLHLFVDAFNPADLTDPAANFFAANDDRSGSTTNSGFSNITLDSARRYFLVVDGFFGTDAGAYGLTISGTGNVAVREVPDSASTLALASLSLGILVIARRWMHSAPAEGC